jgi:hypothetical protein
MNVHQQDKVTRSSSREASAGLSLSVQGVPVALCAGQRSLLTEIRKQDNRFLTKVTYGSYVIVAINRPRCKRFTRRYTRCHTNIEIMTGRLKQR